MKHALIMMPAVFTLALGLQLPTDTAEARMCRNPRTGVLYECNPKPAKPRHFPILHPYMTSYYTTPKGKQMAISDIYLERTSKGWQPTYNTGRKRPPIFSDEDIARFNPIFFRDNLVRITARFVKSKRGWSIIYPRQPKTKPPS
jgi:hypothetical protein